jgi:hypothetical protein
MIKKTVIFILLSIAALADVVLYRGSSLYDRAKERTSNIEKKIRILEKGQNLPAWNNLLDLELAKTYFDRGVGRLGDSQLRDRDFEKAYDRFIRSLALNPFSAPAHFYFAQALQYIQLTGFPVPENSLEEYKKAARLSGRDTEIYAEVGKALFVRWPSLSPEDQLLALDIVKESLVGKDLGRTTAVIEQWDLYIKDYAVMEKVLPEDAAVYQLFARFLGERSLSREERVKYLCRAEDLEFHNAKMELIAGQNALAVFHVQEALEHFRSALAKLQSIHFYEDLVNQSLIDNLDFKNTFKAVYLAMAKCKIEETRTIDAALGDLRAYLNLEDQLSGASSLENFLKERGLLEEKSILTLKNLSLFSFELFLTFKQNRYRDVIQAGQALESSALVIPQGAKTDYAAVLELVGDAYQKLDYLYESNNFYKKSTDVEGPKVSLLAKMIKNYERLNDTEGLQLADQIIHKMAAADTLRAETTIPLGGAYALSFSLDGRRFRLSLSFQEASPEAFPFLSILFNGRVVWEDYLKDPVLSLDLPSEVGPNALRIQALNGPATLLKMTVAFGNEP